MYSIVIPVYNEHGTIPELLRRLTAVVNGLEAPSEVVFVDDGSHDASFALLAEAHARDQRFKLIRLSRNFGHQVAISAGIDHARGAALIVMDGDLQDPPEFIVELIRKWKEGFDVVYAVKRSRKENFLKRFAFHSFYRLLHASSRISIPMDAGHFSLMDRRVVEVLRKMPERNRYVSGMRAWTGFRQVGLPFDREERFSGKPQMTLKRLVELALDGLISFSNAPLRLAIYIGTSVALVSILASIYVIYEKLFTDKAILGWASTIVSITFIGGMILLTLGLIGEYISRIYDEVKQRPLYVISESIGIDNDETRQR
jgi:polyisoprenyl-phosphate glycosyltransferase